MFTKFDDFVAEGLFDNLFGHPYQTMHRKELSKYGLVAKANKDRSKVDVFHKDRLVAYIERVGHKQGIPVWKLEIYAYDTEINKNNLEKPHEGEKPTNFWTKNFTGSSDNALGFFINWWENETKSGASKNPMFKARD